MRNLFNQLPDYPITRLPNSPSPDAALRFPQHRRVWSARERLLELGHVRDDAVDAVAWRRVRVGLRHQAQRFGAPVLAPHLTPPEEHALLGREAVERLAWFGSERREVGHQRKAQSAIVGDVLAERQLAIDLDFVDGSEL